MYGPVRTQVDLDELGQTRMDQDGPRRARTYIILRTNNECHLEYDRNPVNQEPNQVDSSPLYYNLVYYD